MRDDSPDPPSLLPAGEPLPRRGCAVLVLPAGTSVPSALTTLRTTRNHLAVVTSGGSVHGVLTLADVLRRLFPPAPSAGVARSAV